MGERRGICEIKIQVCHINDLLVKLYRTRINFRKCEGFGMTSLFHYRHSERGKCVSNAGAKNPLVKMYTKSFTKQGKLESIGDPSLTLTNRTTTALDDGFESVWVTA